MSRGIGRIALFAALQALPGAGHAADLAAMQSSTVRLLCTAPPRVFSGSGFVVAAGATTVIATARHVISCATDGSQTLSVLIGHGETVPAHLVWSDAASDLALVRTRPLRRPAASLADTAGVAAGAPVIVIGFPRIADLVVAGDDPAVPSVTRGNVSRVSVASASGVRYFEHSAMTSPGSSGGPVFDTDGNVIGVNALIAVALAEDPGNGAIAAAIDAAELARQLQARGMGHERAVPAAAATAAIAAFAAIVLIGAGAILLFTSRGRALWRPAPAASPPDRTATIRIIAGPLAGMRVPVVKPVVLGRDPAGAQIVYPGDDTTVSRRHCRIGFDRATGRFEAIDLDSRNGTFVAAAVPQRLAPNIVTLLAPGTRLLIGSARNAVVVEFG